MNKATYKASDIAEYIINSNKVNDLTNMKLQKILYFVYGIYWREIRKPLFEDKFYAWKFGPVIPSVYSQYKSYGSDPISQSATGNEVKISSTDTDVIDPVMEVFGKSSAAELVGMTHLTAPWIEAFRDPIDNEIREDRLHAYFLEANI